MRYCRPLPLLSLLLSALLLLAACAPAQEDEALQLPNPLREVGSFADFAPLELFIDAPSDAENVRYGILSEEIAQVRFLRDGVSYCYRASYRTDDISGVYADFDAEELGVAASGDAWSVDIRVRTSDGGAAGALAQWSLGAVQCTLSTGDAVTADAVASLALTLAQDAMPYYAPADASDASDAS